MKNLGLHEIRREYLKFFESKGHLILKSFSLIPKNDKSLLLIGAGMAPMKKYFTGELTPPRRRVTTCQKCIRTGDIENVGHTDRHATFFEMLGNFSFGDYFKHEAINWAWEFLTEHLDIKPEQLWATVYLNDDEAFNIWKNEIGLPEDRIVRLGKDDNFWELEVGPSGPCSEIYVDRGEKYGCGKADCKPGCDCDRYIEVWNLVFTQFDKDEKGNYNPLKHPNIDTGMGLERIATVLQGTNNIFEIDAIQDIIKEIEKISGYKYGSDKNKDISVRVITDHIRAITFMISDTIRPSNEGRGYVLRRLIRRAARHGIILGIKKSFLADLCDQIIDSWSVEYEELKENRESIKEVIRNEEEKFLETLDQGMNILDTYVKNIGKEKTLSGQDAFKLYDTYGFPIDLTKEILAERGLKVDEEGFEELMEMQRQRARQARDMDNIGWTNKEDEHLYENIESQFVGYESEKTQSQIIKIIKDNEEVEELSQGKAVILLDKTPFYGESGGQIGDTGLIKGKDFIFKVLDTKKTSKGIHIQIGEVESGIVKKGPVEALVDSQRRRNIRRNHSVTHLVHRALREVLGDHVHQAGSLVTDSYMRFDFTHFEAISAQDLKKVEEIVNQKIFQGLEVETIVTSPEEAYKLGAVGLFEEKYGDIVRVVKMGDFSMELCGGTHVRNTADISMFKILSEGGVSSGVRRIECITGPKVYEYLNENLKTEEEICSLLKTNKSDIISKIKTNSNELKALKKELEDYKLQSAKNNVSEILKASYEIEGAKAIVYKFEGIDVNTLRNIADEVKDKLGQCVLVFSTVNEGKLNFIASVSKSLTNKYNAGNIVREVAKVTGGSGGGRPDMATAGGKDITKVDQALDKAKEMIK